MVVVVVVTVCVAAVVANVDGDDVGDVAAIVDTWWQTETGGHLLTPLPGATGPISSWMATTTISSSLNKWSTACCISRTPEEGKYWTRGVFRLLFDMRNDHPVM